MSYIINQNVPVGSALNLLGSLSDVNISNPSDGDCIVYNSTTGKWENSDNLSTLNSALVYKDYDITTNASAFATIPSLTGYDILSVSINNSASSLMVEGAIRRNSLILITDTAQTRHPNESVPLRVFYVKAKEIQ